MKILTWKQVLRIAAFSCVIVITGCAARQPIFLADSFKQQSIGEIYVLPVVDLRLDRERELKLDEWVHDVVKSKLRKKNYEFSLLAERSYVENLTEEDFEEPTSDWLKNLGPSDARWVLLLVLHNVTTRLEFGSTGNAEMAGYLVDKKDGSVLWRDKALGKYGVGGLVGMAVIGLMARSAIEVATSELIKTLPKNNV